MAWFPDYWSPKEREIYEASFDNIPRLMNDEYLQDMFYGAHFDFSVSARDRDEFREDLFEYLWWEYEIDLDVVFDWEAWRDWYYSG